MGFRVSESEIPTRKEMTGFFTDSTLEALSTVSIE